MNIYVIMSTKELREVTEILYDVARSAKTLAYDDAIVLTFFIIFLFQRCAQGVCECVCLAKKQVALSFSHLAFSRPLQCLQMSSLYTCILDIRIAIFATKATRTVMIM